MVVSCYTYMGRELSWASIFSGCTWSPEPPASSCWIMNVGCCADPFLNISPSTFIEAGMQQGRGEGSLFVYVTSDQSCSKLEVKLWFACCMAVWYYYCSSLEGTGNCQDCNKHSSFTCTLCQHQLQLQACGTQLTRLFLLRDASMEEVEGMTTVFGLSLLIGPAVRHFRWEEDLPKGNPGFGDIG